MTRFVVQRADSVVRVEARSSLHALTGHAPVDGHLDAQLQDGRLDLREPPQGELRLRVADLRSEQSQLDRELHRRLDVDRYPLVLAVLREVVEAGDGSYRMTGDLTVRGRTAVVAGVAVVEAELPVVKLRGSLQLDVRDFGIEPPRLLMFKISPQVDVRLDFLAVLGG